MNETINWRATITWDDMTTVVENGVEVDRVYQDNKVEFDWFKLNVGAENERAD
jgi:hypothetical protein